VKKIKGFIAHQLLLQSAIGRNKKSKQPKKKLSKLRFIMKSKKKH